jgi:hypothetical protein
VGTPSPGRGRGGRRRAAPTARSVLAALAALTVLTGCAAAPTTPPSTTSTIPVQRPAGPARAGVASVPPRAGPEALVIPAIGVSAPLVRLGLQPDRRMEVPEDFSAAGWYGGGPRPGEPGPALRLVACGGAFDRPAATTATT